MPGAGGGRALAVGRAAEDLVVEVDVLDVEGDVLLGLPGDGLGQFGLGHGRQRDLLDDDGGARERGGDLRGLDAAALEEPPDGVGDGRAVDDGAVDDGVGRDGLGAEADDLVALARGLELDRLDGARPDVESDEGRCLRNTGAPAFRRPPRAAAARRPRVGRGRARKGRRRRIKRGATTRLGTRWPDFRARAVTRCSPCSGRASRESQFLPRSDRPRTLIRQRAYRAMLGVPTGRPHTIAIVGRRRSSEPQ